MIKIFLDTRTFVLVYFHLDVKNNIIIGRHFYHLVCKL